MFKAGSWTWLNHSNHFQFEQLSQAFPYYYCYLIQQAQTICNTQTYLLMMNQNIKFLTADSGKGVHANPRCVWAWIRIGNQFCCTCQRCFLLSQLQSENESCLPESPCISKAINSRSVRSFHGRGKVATHATLSRHLLQVSLID